MWSANLPWYDLDEIRPATEAFWSHLARTLRAAGLAGVPDRLSEVPHEELWRSPRLLLSQCCGYDAIGPCRGLLRVVATPRFSAPGCVGPTYSSYVLVRDDAPARAVEDLRGARVALNNPTSHSGTNSLRALVAPHHRGGRFFAEAIVSGCHLTSLALLRAGRVDVAAIDCVVVEMLRRHSPHQLSGVRSLCRTPRVVAPPYVTAASTPPAVVALLRRALAAAVADPALAAARAALLLDGVDELPLEAYRPIAEMERAARQQGYAELPTGARAIAMTA